LIEEIHQTTFVDLNKKIFILIDESHFDKKWALAGKLIFDKTENIFMIFTGSSALELDSNADAARRIKKELIFPCNFPEYLLLKYNIKSPKNAHNSIANLILNNRFEESIETEFEIKESLYSLNNDPNIELKKFLLKYAFPYSLNQNDNEIHRKTVEIINRIIEKEIPSLKSFNTSTNNIISRIISYLALQRPGSSSNIKLAQILSVSPKTVNDILNVLEKTQLIFSVKPYGTGTKMIKKPWKYFF
jgi:hypothetical protein